MTSSKPREVLIDELVAQATPVARPGRTDRDAFRWLGAAAALAILALIVSSPWRAGALVQLLETPRLLAESLLGVAAIISLGRAAFRSGIPSVTPIARQIRWPLALLALWVATYAYGLIDPALPVSMSGKRAHCWLEALVLGAPGLALGCYALRRLWPLHGVWSGTLLGLAAGAMPALAMQFACMYAPLHILLFHLLPGLALGGIGALVGALALRPR